MVIRVPERVKWYSDDISVQSCGVVSRSPTCNGESACCVETAWSTLRPSQFGNKMGGALLDG